MALQDTARSAVSTDALCRWASPWLLPRHRRLNWTTRRTGMASSGKKKTTMAKLNRESRLRERRMDKQARKDARKRAAAHQPVGDTVAGELGESVPPGAEAPAFEAAVPARADT
jgi:hypothetical protein